MPRMSKKLKHEWSMFLNHRGRRCYNSLCRRCVHSCIKEILQEVILIVAAESGLNDKALSPIAKKAHNIPGTETVI